MDQYLDQIHDLESTNKGLTTMNKMVETVSLANFLLFFLFAI